MKKFLFLLIISAVIFLSGCVNNKQEQYNTIKFSSWGSQSELVVLKDLLKEFEIKNPDLKVEFIHIPQNYFQKLHLLFASNMAPDVIFINNIYAPIYIKAGLLEDLSTYFKNELKNDVFIDQAVKTFTYDGKIYAIPRDISNLVIYYNKDIFDKKGIPYPNKNWTPNDLLKTSQRLTDSSTFGINFEDQSLYWLYYLEANGGGILSDDSKEIIINATKSIEALQFYSDLVNKYKVAPSKAQVASMTTAQMFMQGKLGMYLGGRWMVPKFRKSIGFDWDVVNFPASEKNKVLIDSSGWAISKNSNNKENAARLIKFLSSEESIEKFSKSGLIVPARYDVSKSRGFLSPNLKPKNSKVFIDMIKYSKPTPTNANYQQINDILNEAVEPLFNGDKKAEDIMTPKLIKSLKNLL